MKPIYSAENTNDIKTVNIYVKKHEKDPFTDRTYEI